MISKGRKSEEFIDISNIRETDIAAYYLGVTSIPCLIHSPLRNDNKPSFSLYSNDGMTVGYIDFSTREYGSIIDLLSKMWSCSYIDAIKRVKNDMGNNVSLGASIRERCYKRIPVRTSSGTDLKCKVREWRQHDIDYWSSYGISIEWLKYANVYPISHKIVVKDDINFAFGADKYAYAYVEFKEGRTTLKIYQPFNTRGFKWANKHDRSVISLWTKVPLTGDRICICSSLKDALCLWANTGIPALAIQGEGYNMSDTAINELKRRFKKVYICLDNDKAGLEDAKHLASKTGFINVVLPQFEGGKDISDMYKSLNNKETFRQKILSLFV